MSKRAISLIGGTILSMSLVGCGGGSSSKSTTTIASAVTAAPNPAAGALESLLITSVPSGYQQIPDTDADAGPSDLAKAVQDDGGDDAQAVLTANGFVQGYQRAWDTKDQSHLITVFIYEFSKPEGPPAYSKRGLTQLDGDTTIKSVPFSITGIPGANARSITDPQSSSTPGAVVFFEKGKYDVQVDVLGTSDADNRALVQKLALDQYGRL